MIARDCQARLREFLSDPASYPERTAHVELLETHISDVYLTDHWVYKVKKPLLLPFLDYSHLEARREACEVELRINRRASHDVYHGVSQIMRDKTGKLSIDGAGKPVEYAVKMRRIPDKDMLDRILKQRSLTDHERESIVDHLIDFYHKVPPATISPSTYCRRFQGLIDENRSSLFDLCQKLELDPTACLTVISRQKLLLHRLEPIMAERIRYGRIVEGHGDLRPEHIILEKHVSLIDAIDFSEDMRTVDIADDLAFLSMECTQIGQTELGCTIRTRVLDRLSDQAPHQLINFYSSYRATVRAKVLLLQALGKPSQERRAKVLEYESYLAMAHNCLTQTMPSFTFIVAGPMGSGKTSLSLAIERDLGAIHLETDELRRELSRGTSNSSAYGEGSYSNSSRLKVYQKMAQTMREHLDRGMNVIVDGTFSEKPYIDCILEPLIKEQRPYLILVCECSPQETIERIKFRASHHLSRSEARPDLYLEQIRKCQWNFTNYNHCTIQTHFTIEHQLLDTYRAVARSFDHMEASFSQPPRNAAMESCEIDGDRSRRESS